MKPEELKKKREKDRKGFAKPVPEKEDEDGSETTEDPTSGEEPPQRGATRAKGIGVQIREKTGLLESRRRSNGKENPRRPCLGYRPRA